MKRERLLKTNTVLDSVVINVRSNIGILLAFIVMFLFLSIFTDYFLTSSNVLNVMRQITTNMNLAIGTMLAILLAGIDLSIGAIVALSGCVTAKLMATLGVSAIVAASVGVFVGLLVGAASGTIIAYTRMPPFIATLAMQNICRGASYLIASGQPIAIKDEGFQNMGMGYVLGVPLPVFYTLFLLIAAFIILNRSKLGRYIYAIGGNREAARYSGINVKAVEIFVYTFSGMLAAFTGVIYTARMASGQPNVAIGYETDAISAVVLGGVSMSGGVGTLGGVVLGAFVIGIISNGLNLLRINTFWQYVVKGTIILVAVYIDMHRKRKERI